MLGDIRAFYFIIDLFMSIYIYIYIYLIWPTVVDGNQKAPFSIVTTSRC